MAPTSQSMNRPWSSCSVARQTGCANNSPKRLNATSREAGTTASTKPFLRLTPTAFVTDASGTFVARVHPGTVGFLVWDDIVAHAMPAEVLIQGLWDSHAASSPLSLPVVAYRVAAPIGGGRPLPTPLWLAGHSGHPSAARGSLQPEAMATSPAVQVSCSLQPWPFCRRLHRARTNPASAPRALEAALPP